MSAFHTEVSVVHIEAQPIAGQPDALMVEATIGLPVPMGQGQVGVIGLGVVAFKIDKEGADKITAAATLLEDKPSLPRDFTIANSMSVVEEAAQAMKKATGQ